MDIDTHTRVMTTAEFESLKKKLELLEQQMYYIETRLERYDKSTIYNRIKNYLSSWWSWSGDDRLMETELLLREFNTEGDREEGDPSGSQRGGESVVYNRWMFWNKDEQERGLNL